MKILVCLGVLVLLAAGGILPFIFGVGAYILCATLERTSFGSKTQSKHSKI